MQPDLARYAEKLRTAYWFIPGIMLLSAILLSFITIAIDEAYPATLENFLGWIDIADPDGAHAFLSVVSGSMIGVTGLTFSITIAALSQASSQLGPRVLNTFLRDRGNQFVLGAFLATYVYCLLIIRSITNTVEYTFVPNLSLFIAVLLSISDVVLLVYFFHHVTVILQADHVIASLGRDLDKSIQRIFPEKADYSMYGHSLKSDEDLPLVMEEETPQVLESEVAGYVQDIDIDDLVEIAKEHDIFLQAIHRPGDFVQKGGSLVKIWPRDFEDEEVTNSMRKAFVLGDQRLRLNDIEYLVNQLVEMAVRALASGTTDPFTAIACIDQLGSGLCGLMARTIPHGYHYDSEGELRLLTDALTFSGIIEAAFNQIRQNASSDVAVTIRLLDAIHGMSSHIQTREQKSTLIRQAEMLNRSGKQVPEKWDQEDIRERFESVMKALIA